MRLFFKEMFHESFQMFRVFEAMIEIRDTRNKTRTIFWRLKRIDRCKKKLSHFVHLSLVVDHNHDEIVPIAVTGVL